MASKLRWSPPLTRLCFPKIPALYVVFFAVCVVCMGTPEPPPTVPGLHPPPARKGRSTLTLDGIWRYLADTGRRAETERWSDRPPAAAEEIAVPGRLPVTGSEPDAPLWFWRRFDPPVGWKGQTVRLRFGAVAEKGQIWLNGTRLGEHVGGTVPFEFDITSVLRPGESNLLAVRATASTQSRAGLRQSVTLLAHDEAYLADCFPGADGLGHINAAVTLVNSSTKSGDALLEARLVSVDMPKRDLKRTQQALAVGPGRNKTAILVSVPRRALRVWTPAEPKLYALQLVLRQGQDILDTLETLFGFREFGLRDRTVFLNGEPLTLVRAQKAPRLPESPLREEDLRSARDTLRQLKREGVNLISLTAPDPALLRFADEEGLLVIERGSPGLRGKAAADELRALVLRDRAHPCLLAWSSGEVDPETVRAVRELDPGRFLVVGSAQTPVVWAPGASTPAPTPPAGLF